MQSIGCLSSLAWWASLWQHGWLGNELFRSRSSSRLCWLGNELFDSLSSGRVLRHLRSLLQHQLPRHLRQAAAQGAQQRNIRCMHIGL